MGLVTDFEFAQCWSQEVLVGLFIIDYLETVLLQTSPAGLVQSLDKRNHSPDGMLQRLSFINVNRRILGWGDNV